MNRWSAFIVCVVMGLLCFCALIGARSAVSRVNAPTVTSPTSRPKTDPVPQGPRDTVANADHPHGIFEGRKADEWKDFGQMHAMFVEHFVASKGFGEGRIPHMEDHLRFNQLLYAEGERYRVGDVQLVSLNQGAEPFAYVIKNAQDPLRKQLPRATHRELTSGENRALRRVMNERLPVALEHNESGTTLIGAITASVGCLKCHEVKEGTLLGAFSYKLQPEAAVASRDKPR